MYTIEKKQGYLKFNHIPYDIKTKKKHIPVSSFMHNLFSYNVKRAFYPNKY